MKPQEAISLEEGQQSAQKIEKVFDLREQSFKLNSEIEKSKKEGREPLESSLEILEQLNKESEELMKDPAVSEGVMQVALEWNELRNNLTLIREVESKLGDFLRKYFEEKSIETDWPRIASVRFDKYENKVSILLAEHRLPFKGDTFSEDDLRKIRGGIGEILREIFGEGVTLSSKYSSYRWWQTLLSKYVSNELEITVSDQKFDPSDYKTYEDLPEEEKYKFSPMGDGSFVRKEAAKGRWKAEEKAREFNSYQRSLWQKIRGKDKKTAVDFAQEEAKKMDEFEMAKIESRKIRESLPEEIKKELEGAHFEGEERVDSNDPVLISATGLDDAIGTVRLAGASQNWDIAYAISTLWYGGKDTGTEASVSGASNGWGYAQPSIKVSSNGVDYEWLAF